MTNVREDFYHGRKFLRNESIFDIRLTKFGDKKIFINETSTQRNRHFSRDALLPNVKTSILKYIWTNNGNTFLCTGSGYSPAKYIRGERDLSRILTKYSNAKNEEENHF